MVALEAAAAGLPALVAAHGGLPEIVIHQQTGLHVPPGDIDAWAQAMLTLLTQPSRATQLGDAARLRARTHFSLPSAVDQWLALFSQISCNPSRPALL
jgi:glycosyltransferase involved in cell wall biosynthesis